MRALAIALLYCGCALASGDPPKKHLEFAKDVKPILEKKCKPCHFSGGVVFARMPFDRQETIISLGEKKLFTRIHDEGDRAILRAFFAQQAQPAP
jgi:hypothetical protein